MSSFTSLRALRAAPLTSRAFSTSQRTAFARMTLIGRLGVQPELANTSTGTELVRYTIATSQGSGDNRKTSWWNLVAFLKEGAQREFILGLPKGTLVHVEVDASRNPYEAEGGKTQYGLNLTQREINVLSFPKNQGAEEEAAE
ncbi:hypothetical protein EJ06DRAFT_486684 [Trichodelitschia bisporula]|uniref:Single-stranded DNA-binding protein n=1 Tax=Trichodelitschia bisporula TaxID=703511 RepID=A0A6G1I7X5_9PEZI|nr:hypothetical protein EJ06DRAFT_486684 [Trichodelitschia bisporula]